MSRTSWSAIRCWSAPTIRSARRRPKSAADDRQSRPHARHQGVRRPRAAARGQGLADRCRLRQRLHRQQRRRRQRRFRRTVGPGELARRRRPRRLPRRGRRLRGNADARPHLARASRAAARHRGRRSDRAADRPADHRPDRRSRLCAGRSQRARRAARLLVRAGRIGAEEAAAIRSDRRRRAQSRGMPGAAAEGTATGSIPRCRRCSTISSCWPSTTARS